MLIPEGLFVHLPHIKNLIFFLNHKLKENPTLATLLLENSETIDAHLGTMYGSILKEFPAFFIKQLLLDRDSQGNIQLSRLETERLLAELVSAELKKRKDIDKTYKGSFAAITTFFGYQGRSSFPSLFDCSLASTYGFIAAMLINKGITGYVPTARGVTGPVTDW